MKQNCDASKDVIDAIRVRSMHHSRSLEDRLQASLNQFYRTVVIFGLVVLALRLGYQAVTLATLPHIILLFACLIGLVVVGNEINRAAAHQKRLAELDAYSNPGVAKSDVTYCEIEPGVRS